MKPVCLTISYDFANIMKEAATHTVRDLMFRKHLSYLYEKCLKISHSVGIDSPTVQTLLGVQRRNIHSFLDILGICGQRNGFPNL